MLKRILLTMILSLTLAAPAAAEINGLYVGGKFLYGYQSHSGASIFGSSNSGSVFGGGGFVGYDFYQQSDTPIRAEIEYAFRGNLYNSEAGPGYTADTHYNMQTLLVNFYYDFYNESAFTPYVGAGIGAGFITGEYNYNIGGNKLKGELDDTVLAWNVGAGVGYAINEQITADLGYRYLSTTNSNKEAAGYDLKTYTSAHEVSVGVRFNF